MAGQLIPIITEDSRMLKTKFTALLLAIVAGIALTGQVSAAQTDGAKSPSPTLNRILERGALVIGMTGDMPPMNMTNKDGIIIGMEADLAGYMADAMGVKLKIETMPFGGSCHQMMQGFAGCMIDRII